MLLLLAVQLAGSGRQAGAEQLAGAARQAGRAASGTRHMGRGDSEGK